MARFSLNGGDEIDGYEDESGPSNRRQPRKKLKIMAPSGTTSAASASASAPPQPPPPRPRPAVVIHDDEEEEEEDDSEDAESYEEDDESEEEEALEEEYSEPLPRVNEGAAAAAASVDESDSYDNKKLTLTLTDSDVLDCPICYENLKIPVYQCENGHIACGTCCVKIRNKCPTCSFPTGYSRCRAIEKILEASQVSCKNAIYGCPTVMKYYIKQEHERRCYHSACSCPECDFTDSHWKLYHHIEAKHHATSFHFASSFSASIPEYQDYRLLRELTLGTVFALKQFTARQGKAVTLVQIAPKSHSEKYNYELKTKDGETSLILKSHVVCVPKLADYHPTKHYLLVDDFRDHHGRVTFDVCINPLTY